MSGKWIPVTDEDQLRQNELKRQAELIERQRAKRLIEERKIQEMKEMNEKIFDSHVRRNLSLLDNVDVTLKNEIEKSEKALSELRNERRSLTIEKDNLERKIKKAEEDIRYNTTQDATLIAQDLARYKEMYRDKEQELKRIEGEISASESEVDWLMKSVNDDFLTNNSILSDEIMHLGEAISSKIESNINCDPLCGFALSISGRVLKEILSEDVRLEGFHDLRERLISINEFVDDSIQKIENNHISTARIIDIATKIQNAYINSDEYSVQLFGNYQCMATIIVTFPDGSRSEIKMRPDGNGGIDSAMVNLIDDGGDIEYHNRRCAEMSAEISKAAGFQDIGDNLDEDELKNWTEAQIKSDAIIEAETEIKFREYLRNH